MRLPRQPPPVLSALILWISIVTPTLAGNAPRRPQPLQLMNATFGAPPEAIWLKPGNDIGLTDEQRARMEAILEGVTPRWQQLINESHAIRIQLIRIDPGSPDYPATAKRLAREAADKTAQLIELYSDTRLKLHAVFRPAQLERSREIMAQRRAELAAQRARWLKEREMKNQQDKQPSTGAARP